SRTGSRSNCPTDAACAIPFWVSSASVLPNKRPCALATDSPCLIRISMPSFRAPSGRDQNAPALVARDNAVGRGGADALDLGRGELEMASVATVADEPGCPRALEAGSQALVAISERGGQLSRFGGTGGRSRRQLGIDFGLALRHLTPKGLDLLLNRRGAGGQGGQGGVDRLLIHHGDQFFVFQLATTLVQVTHLLVHRLKVPGRRAARGIHALFDPAAALV